MIIENYEKIVKNIVRSIRNGTITSKNSNKLQGYSAAELYSMFVNSFNFKQGRIKITPTYVVNSLDDIVLTIELPFSILYLTDIYFKGIGETIEIGFYGPANIITFNLSNTNVDHTLFTNSECYVDYIEYNTHIDEVIDVIADAL